MTYLVEQIKALWRDPVKFVERANGLRLRGYQEDVIRAVVDSVLHKRGLSFVIMFPRQSGKNELQAQLECYLLTLFSEVDVEILKASPTLIPQSKNSMLRLEQVMSKNIFIKKVWRKRDISKYMVNRARINFVSAAPDSKIVGATASLLLEVDEAQDVTCAKYDKELAPMAASTNATRAFFGTAWTNSTLLARELRVARAAEAQDGIRRVFVISAQEVAQEVPEYKAFVDGYVARLGRDNPLVKSQFFSEEILQQGTLFPAERVALMRGQHQSQSAPSAGRVYCLLVDVAGQEESGEHLKFTNIRDSTVCTIVEVDMSTLIDEGMKAPTYRVMQRRVWTGEKQVQLYRELRALANLWQARYVVVDATGVGMGLAAFLEESLPGKVIKFYFSPSNKSAAGWSFITICDSGRWQEAADADAFQEQFFKQLSTCNYEVEAGPKHTLKYGSPFHETEAPGEYIHDDFVMSAVLASVLDSQDWAVSGPALVVHAADPLKDMKGF
jgi:hypothetical protein